MLQVTTDASVFVLAVIALAGRPVRFRQKWERNDCERTGYACNDETEWLEERAAIRGEILNASQIVWQAAVLTVPCVIGNK